MALRFLNSGYFAGKVGIGTETSYTVGGTAQVTIATGSAETALAFGPSNNDMLYMRSAGSQGNFQFQTSVNSGNSGSVQLQPFGGNVGIGTTNPNAKLDIQGTQGQLFSVTDDLSGEIFAVSDISGVPIMTVNSSGVSYFDGNVGIGTTSPGAKLDVIGGSLKVSDTYATVKIIGTGGLSRVFLGDTADEDVGYLEYNHISNYFRIGVNAAERMRIDSSGNVGIGVTNPNGKLEVNGIVKIGNVTTGLSMNGSSATEFLISGADTGGNAWNSIHIKADGNDGLFIEKDTNNVGIGTTSPSKRLDIRTSGTGDGITLATSTPKTFAQIINGNSEAFPYGKFTMNYGDTTPVQIVALSNELQLSGGYTTGGKISFRTATSEQMRLTETGLGIGTTTPDFKLDVDGTFGVSDLPFNTDSVSVLVADETIGAELTTNGDFAIDADWAKGSGVTIASGVGTWTNTVNNVGLSQSITFTANAYYKCNVTVSNYSSGSFRFRYPGISSPRITANGTYSLIIKADQSTNNTLYLQGETNGDANVNFSIDNVSVKQITSASNQIQKRELGTGAFGPTPVGAYLPLAGGTMTGNTDHNDNVFSKYGTADQLRIWNNGSNSYIFNYTSGNINIGNDAVDKDVIFYADRGDGLEDVFFRLDGSETNGTTVLGVTLFPDKSQARFGNQGDLRIYHDGSNSYIQDTGTGTLNLQGSTQVLIGGTNGEVGVQYVENAGVGLRHNNVTKLSTESTGINVVGGIKIDSALLSNQENTDVDTGTETVASVAIATYTAAFFDFVIKKTTNVRSGTVYACHDGTNVEFTETSTNDLGDTSDVTLSVDISGDNMRLLATVTSDDWSVKSLIRAI
jgi:hypothetical protein